MGQRTSVVLSAVVAVCGVISRASMGADASTAQSPFHDPIYCDASGVSSTEPAPQTQSLSEQRPLMAALAPTAVGSALQQARINVFGYVEGSYQYNFDHPTVQPVNSTTRLLDILQHDKVYLNQVDLTIERTVDLDSHQFDVGGRLESVFGQDARFIHANGLLDHQQGGNPDVIPPQLGGEYQYDLYQAYVDFGIPIGDGLRIRAGKFSFFKPIDPNASIFYTHTIAFAETFPYTNTGITGMYRFNDAISAEAGISRGWDQALKDNNGAIDGLARVNWKPSESQRVIASLIVGPELPGNNSDYTTLFDLTYKQAFGDNFAIFADGLYGHQVHPTMFALPGSFVPVPGDTVTHSTANWYGVSADAVYSVNRFLDVAARGEWYRDEEGFTTGQSGNAYEATVGATIYPLTDTLLGRNVQLRPEVRYDYASRRLFDLSPAGIGQKHDQVTFAIDAIVNF